MSKSETKFVKIHAHERHGDQSGSDLYSCPDGNRHKEGMTLLQAYIRNLGTCRSDAKRESQAEAPWSERVSMRSSGAESLVVAEKVL